MEPRQRWSGKWTSRNNFWVINSTWRWPLSYIRSFVTMPATATELWWSIWCECKFYFNCRQLIVKCPLPYLAAIVDYERSRWSQSVEACLPRICYIIFVNDSSRDFFFFLLFDTQKYLHNRIGLADSFTARTRDRRETKRGLLCACDTVNRRESERDYHVKCRIIWMNSKGQYVSGANSRSLTKE